MTDHDTKTAVTGEHLLDARGLACPLPVLKAKKAMRDVAKGEVLTILATDPGAVEDFTAFCAVTGHHQESHDEVDGVFRFVIRKVR